MTAAPETTAGRPQLPTGRRPLPWWGDAFLLTGLAVFLVLLTWALTTPTWVVDLDVAIRDSVEADRPDWLWWIARVVNFLGQGSPLAIAAAVAAGLLAYRTRSIRPVALLLTAYFLVGAVIQPLKYWTDRLPPRAGPGGQEYGPPYPDAAHAVLFGGGGEAHSYPSGHGVNTIVWWALLVLFLSPMYARLRDRRIVWLMRVGPPVLVTWSMVTLNYHWLTDALAGVACGLLVEIVLKLLPWWTVPLPRFLRRWERS